MRARDLVESWWTRLRDEGVALDGRQLESAMRVADILEASARRDRLLASVQGIFAKNEREAALLRRIAAPGDATAVRPAGTRLPRKRRMRRPAAALAAALALIAAGLVWFVSSRLPPPSATPLIRPGVVAISEAPAPSQPAVASGLRATSAPARLRTAVVRPLPPWTVLAKASLFLVPALLFAALLLWLRARAPAWTRLPVAKVEDRLNNNLPAPDEAGLFAGGGLRALAAALTGPSDEKADVMDVRRTVEATAGHAGLLQIAWRPRLIDSPVHLAIERRSREDHVSELYFRVADGLRAHGAEASVSQYRDDLAARRDELGRLVGRQRADPAESQALLITVGDGDAMFDPASLDPHPTRLRATEGWPRKVLLSVRPVLLWGHREERLGAAAMGVAPASARGLAALADRLSSRQPLRGVFGVRSRGAAPAPSCGRTQ